MIMIGHWLWHPLIQFARSHLESPPSFRMCLPNNNHQKALGLCACDLYVNSQWESEIRKGLRNEISTPAVSWPAILCEGERERERIKDSGGIKLCPFQLHYLPLF